MTKNIIVNDLEALPMSFELVRGKPSSEVAPRSLTGERRTRDPKVITPVPQHEKNPSYAFDMPARLMLVFRRRCEFLNDFRCSGKQRFRTFQRA